MKHTRIKWKNLSLFYVPHYKQRAKRNIKDIDNNTKHKPKDREIIWKVMI